MTNVPRPAGADPAAAALLAESGWRPRRDWLKDKVWMPGLTKGKVSRAEPDARTGMHQLRHRAAVAWGSGGASIKDVAEYLGHTDAGFTLRTYIHLMPNASDRMRAAAERGPGRMCPDVPTDASEVQK